MEAQIFSTARRLFFRIPLIGWIARDLWFDFDANIWFLAVALFSLWVIAFATWGLPALFLPAVAAAPICLLVLVLLTRG